MSSDHPLLLDTGNERTLKAAVLTYAVRSGLITFGATVAQEVALGTLRRRVDLAVASDRLTAFEIKSSADSLRRLSDQIEAYSGAFDQVILVLATRHVSAAAQIAPRHVGLWQADCEVGLKVLRPPHARSRATHAGTVGAMTIAELERAFGRRNLSRSEWVSFASRYSLKACRQHALATFRRRFEKSSAAFWDEADLLRTFSGNQVDQLSRFFSRREAIKEQRSRHGQFWEQWALNANAEFARLQLEFVAR